MSSAEHAAEAPHEIVRRAWKDIIVAVISEVRQDRLPLMSAGVAFFALLALFPALIALVTLYGLVADPLEVQSHLLWLTRVLPPAAADLVREEIRNTVSAGKSGLSLGLVASVSAAIWTASGSVNALILALNSAYEEQEGRSFWRLRGLVLLFTLGTLLLGILALGLVVVIPPVLKFIGLRSVGTLLIGLLRWPLLALLMMVGLMLFYSYGPDRVPRRFNWVSWGAVIATVLWLLSSGLFSLYVSSFGSYNKTYGTLGGGIVLLLWLFLSAFLVLLGAEINSEIERRAGHGKMTHRTPTI